MADRIERAKRAWRRLFARSRAGPVLPEEQREVEGPHVRVLGRRGPARPLPCGHHPRGVPGLPAYSPHEGVDSSRGRGYNLVMGWGIGPQRTGEMP